MNFPHALKQALASRPIPPSILSDLEITYEERDGKNYRHLKILGSGKVRFARQSGRFHTDAFAPVKTGEIEQILSHLFAHEFWKIKNKRSSGKRVTLTVRIGAHHRSVTLPYAEIQRELKDQIDQGRMLERPAGRFLVATLWIEGLIKRLEKEQPVLV